MSEHMNTRSYVRAAPGHFGILHKNICQGDHFFVQYAEIKLFQKNY